MWDDISKRNYMILFQLVYARRYAMKKRANQCTKNRAQFRLLCLARKLSVISLALHGITDICQGLLGIVFFLVSHIFCWNFSRLAFLALDSLPLNFGFPRAIWNRSVSGLWICITTHIENYSNCSLRGTLIRGKMLNIEAFLIFFLVCSVFATHSATWYWYTVWNLSF